jgi:DivIVA domain-containing protein
MWFWALVVVLVIGAVTVLLVGSGDTLSDVYEDRPDQTIPVGRPLTSDDLGDISFTTAMRGYRMDEVDALVDRLRADLLVRESAELADTTSAASSTSVAALPETESAVETTMPIPQVERPEIELPGGATRAPDPGSTDPGQTGRE